MTRVLWCVYHQGFSNLEDLLTRNDLVDLQIAEQAGHLPVGSVTADESVKGYAVQGPITFLDDPESRYPEAARQEFIVHVLLAVMIMPIQRPANMTKMLW